VDPELLRLVVVPTLEAFLKSYRDSPLKRQLL
jgi:hypothetical protein